MFERAQSSRAAALLLAIACGAPAVLSTSGCGTPRATQQLDYGLGGCLVGTGVVGGAIVGTSVLYDARAQNADGSFIAVADQAGVSLWPWGVGIAALGLASGGALIAAGAMIDVPDESDAAAAASTTPTMPHEDPPTGGSTPRKKPREKSTVVNAPAQDPATTTSPAPTTNP